MQQPQLGSMQSHGRLIPVTPSIQAISANGTVFEKRNEAESDASGRFWAALAKGSAGSTGLIVGNVVMASLPSGAVFPGIPGAVLFILV